jgi:hypothetical protein
VNIDGRDYPINVHVVEGEIMKHKLLLGADFLNSVRIIMDKGEIIIKTSGSTHEDDEIREICQLDVTTDEENSIDVTHRT